MTVLIVCVVIAVVATYWLSAARRPIDTGARPADRASPPPMPVPSEVKPSRISRGVLTSGSLAFDVAASTIPTDEFRGTDLGPEDIPALTTPYAVGPSSPAAPGEDDLVLGIVVDGVPRAYPLPILNYHWVVNDVVDGRAVAIFWDPVAGAAAAYQAKADDGRAEFGVSGHFFRGNSLFYEKRTTSLFLPLGGRFVTGPLAGRALQPLPLWRQRWSTWLDRWPGSRVLSTETGHERPYDTDPYVAVSTAAGGSADYFATDTMLVRPARTDPQQRLDPKEWVVGFLTAKGQAYCCALRELPDDETAPYLEIDGARVLRLPGNGARAALSGGVWPQQAICFYFAWFGVHPDTLVWSSTAPEEVEG